jgi:hypothetical protein
MKNILLLVLCFIVIRSTASAQAPTVPRRPTVRVVTAAQVNGLYRDGRNDFRILALGRNKLKVQFNGEWMTRGGYPNIGEAIGEADTVGNVATFIPRDTTKCKITLTFLANRMEVTQEGLDAGCGFGHNVVASGIYRHVKGGRPKFIPTR